MEYNFYLWRELWKQSLKYSDMTAKQLHKSAFVLDSHCDAPLRLLRNGADFGVRCDEGHYDYIRMKEGGVDASFFAVYTSNALAPDEATRCALQLIAQINDSLWKNRDKAALATSVREGRELKEQGLCAIYMGMENGSPIQKDLSLLRLFYKMGIRYITLTHTGNNEICDSCSAPRKRWHGLSPFGKEVIAEMNRLGMLVDVSHISDESFYDVIEYSSKPVAATHSCCRALADHPRNMSDDMIRALAAAGGVIQINFYPVFLDSGFSVTLKDSGIIERGDKAESEFIADPADPVKRAAWYAVQDELQSLPRPSYRKIVDHIDHAVSIAGIDHVGIGSDFDGIEVTPDGMEDISCIGKVFDEMRARGYSEEEIGKVAGGNFLRLLDEIVVNK